jgi:nucleoside-diphosphate-sugar epimerase
MEKDTYTQQKTRQRILIVGNLGYIGPVLTHHFRSIGLNSKLIGLDTGYFSGCLIDPYTSIDQQIDEQIYGDVRKINSIDLPEADTVIYLAAISNDPMGNVYEKPTSEINYKAAVELAKIYKSRGAKSFVFASSCSVYGAGGDSAKREDDLLNPLTAYARSKIDAEIELEPLSSEDFHVTCLRFATACGASPRLRLDLVLNDFVASALLKKEIEILSDGMPWRPLIDVEDMCKAIVWAKDRHTDQHFLALNVGFESWNYRIKDLAIAVSKNLKGVEVRVNPNAAADKRSYRVDFSLYKKLAPENQTPKSLDTTIAELIYNIRSSTFRSDDFRNSHLIRLNTIKNLRDRERLDASLYWIDVNSQFKRSITDASSVTHS